MIITNDLSVSINGAKILKDISISIQPGRWTCLVGPNGAGKTTLLKVLLGVSPYSGTVTDNGKEVYRDQKRNVAFVPQQPHIPAGMSVREYVSLGRSKKDGWGRDSSRGARYVSQILQQTQLFGMHDRPINSLSGGEMQRALIARALAQEPELILLDEPTSALDLHHQISVLNEIEILKEQGVTILSTMHDITLAAMFAEYIVVMHEGKVTVSGEAATVIHSPELRSAFDNRINVYTLDGGRPVIMASKDDVIEREIPRKGV